MSEEIKSILKMVEDGKITSEEGEKLIDSLGERNELSKQTFKPSKGKFIHIEVKDSDSEDGNTLVKINVPIALAKTVFKIGNIKNQIMVNANGIELDFDEIINMIDSNVVGELVNIETEDTIVRIWVD